MTEVQKFSAFRLPENALLQVMSKMGYYQLISLSLVSKRSKKLVQSLNLPCYKLVVNPDHPMDISVYPESQNYSVKFFLTSDDGDGLINLNQFPADVLVEIENNTGGEVDEDDEWGSDDEEENIDEPDLQEFRWTNQGMNRSQWINHIHSLFRKYVQFIASFDCCDEVSDLPELRQNLPRFTDLRINMSHPLVGDPCRERCRNMLNTFANDVKNLGLSCSLVDPFTPEYKLQNLGMHNFDEFDLDMENVQLDDILAINARQVRIYQDNFAIPLTILNRFFKSWIRGSNPRMSFIIFEFPSEVVPDVNILLKGIHYQLVPEERERRFEGRGRPIQGGYDLRNKKGISGTLLLRHHHSAHIEFLVWN